MGIKGIDSVNRTAIHTDTPPPAPCSHHSVTYTVGKLMFSSCPAELKKCTGATYRLSEPAVVRSEVTAVAAMCLFFVGEREKRQGFRPKQRKIVAATTLCTRNLLHVPYLTHSTGSGWQRSTYQISTDVSRWSRGRMSLLMLLLLRGYTTEVKEMRHTEKQRRRPRYSALQPVSKLPLLRPVTKNWPSRLVDDYRTTRKQTIAAETHSASWRLQQQQQQQQQR